MWYSGRRHRSRKRICFTLCTSAVLWEPFFVPVKCLQAPPLARKPRHLNARNTSTAGEKHQTKAFTSAFVCTWLLSRWSAVTYSNTTIKVVCFWLSQCFSWLLRKQTTPSPETSVLQVCSVPQYCRGGQTHSADNNTNTVGHIDKKKPPLHYMCRRR